MRRRRKRARGCGKYKPFIYSANFTRFLQRLSSVKHKSYERFAYKICLREHDIPVNYNTYNILISIYLQYLSIIMRVLRGYVAIMTFTVLNLPPFIYHSFSNYAFSQIIRQLIHFQRRNLQIINIICIVCIHFEKSRYLYSFKPAVTKTYFFQTRTIFFYCKSKL